MIEAGIEAACRHFKPKLALLLVVFSYNEKLMFVDYANRMPNPEAEVTLETI